MNRISLILLVLLAGSLAYIGFGLLMAWANVRRAVTEYDRYVAELNGQANLWHTNSSAPREEDRGLRHD